MRLRVLKYSILKLYNLVFKTINKLYLQGVKVYTNAEFSEIHTSGHAKSEELKWMLRIIKMKSKKMKFRVNS